MNILHWVDDFLFKNVFEPVAWNIEQNFGYTSVRIAQLLLLGVVVSGYAHSWTVLILACSASSGLFFVFDAARKRKRTGLANELRLELFHARMILVLGACYLSVQMLFGAGVWSLTINIFCFMASLYFAACNAMPPWFRQTRTRESTQPA